MLSKYASPLSAEKFLFDAALELQAAPPTFDCKTIRLANKTVYLATVNFLGYSSTNSAYKFKTACTQASEDFIRFHGSCLSEVTGYAEARNAVLSHPHVAFEIEALFLQSTADNQPRASIPIIQESPPEEIANLEMELYTPQNEGCTQSFGSQITLPSTVGSFRNLLMTLQYSIREENEHLASRLRENTNILEQIQDINRELNQLMMQ